MASIQDTLKLKSDRNALGIEPVEWQHALGQAQPAPDVGIRHASIKGNERDRFHVAAIPEKVGCHFHRQGGEDYAIVSGKGMLYCGTVAHDNSNEVQWEDPLPVKQGDSFTIPAGWAHQLCKRGNDDLTLVFRCSDSHLNIDRILLPDAPFIELSARIG